VTQPDNGVPAAHGHDQVVADEELDRLGRRHVALRLYQQLIGKPKDWSVRVGLLGAWGEGKTTVATWVANRARSEGHIAVFYSPTIALSREEIWADLVEKLLSAFGDEGTVEASWLARARAWVRPHWRCAIGLPKEEGDLLRIRTRSELRRLANALRGVAKLDKRVEVAHSAIAQFVSMGPEHLKAIRAELGGDRRVLVIIDDIDRADPKLIPQLLLGLRDLLDLPGFSFLLPFDENVVAKALRNYNRAWGDGRIFLDKILDYRVHLAPVEPAERQALFSAVLAEVCSFVPPAAASGFGPWLPANPRRLKAIARSLIVLREEAARHRPDEIDWRSVIFAALLRAEHEPFARAFAEQTFGNRDPDTVTRQSFEIYRRTGQDGRDEAERGRLEKLADTHAVTDGATRQRLIALGDAWRRSVGISDPARALYSARLLERASQGVTWRDYDSGSCPSWWCRCWGWSSADRR
jgi:hypothetical protein